MSQETEFNEQRNLNTGLEDKTVVITRAEHQAQEVAQLLSNKGAKSVNYPCISIVLPDKPQTLDDALKRAARGDFDWLIITSANTVNMLNQRLDKLNLTLDKIDVAAIGPRTAAAAEKHLRLAIDVVPEAFVAEGLIEALPSMRGKAVFLPQASLARPTLAQGLISAGANVTVVEAYQIEIGKGGAPVPQMLTAGQIDAVIFSSPSTVRYFLERLRNERGHSDDLRGVCLAALGPVTAKCMKELALPVDVQPERYTLEDLADALEEHYKTSAGNRLKNKQAIYE